MKEADRPAGILVFAALFVTTLFGAGCAPYTDQMPGARAQAVISTNAPADTLFEIAVGALRSSKFNISRKNPASFELEGYITYPLVGAAPVIVKTKCIRETGRIVLIYGVFQRGDKDETTDVIGYFPRTAKDLQQKTISQLQQRGFSAYAW